MIDTMTMVDDLLLDTLAVQNMDHVLSFFGHNKNRRPMIFGPYLKAATLSSGDRFPVISVLSDGLGQNDHVPREWRKLTTDNLIRDTVIYLAKAALDPMIAAIPRQPRMIHQLGFYVVPDLPHHIVRFYHCTEALTPRQLAASQTLSVAQAVYARGSATLTDAFWDTLKTDVVTVERPKDMVFPFADMLRDEATMLAERFELELRLDMTMEEYLKSRELL